MSAKQANNYLACITGTLYEPQGERNIYAKRETCAKHQTRGEENIRHLHISRKTPYLPPQILHNLCFSFLLGITAVPREIENNAYAKFWGANKVHYGRSREMCKWCIKLYFSPPLVSRFALVPRFAQNAAFASLG